DQTAIGIFVMEVTSTATAIPYTCAHVHAGFPANPGAGHDDDHFLPLRIAHTGDADYRPGFGRRFRKGCGCPARRDGRAALAARMGAAQYRRLMRPVSVSFEARRDPRVRSGISPITFADAVECLSAQTEVGRQRRTTQLSARADVGRRKVSISIG